MSDKTYVAKRDVHTKNHGVVTKSLGGMPRSEVDALILHLCGGGLTEKDTALAMQYGRELTENGSVTVKDVFITEESKAC